MHVTSVSWGWMKLASFLSDGKCISLHTSYHLGVSLLMICCILLRRTSILSKLEKSIKTQEQEVVYLGK